MMRQLKKSVEIEKMPSVRVRPTLKVELKHRVMNCKVPSQPPSEAINMSTLNEKVLEAMKKSKRANLGGDNTQMQILKSC